MSLPGFSDQDKHISYVIESILHFTLLGSPMSHQTPSVSWTDEMT